MGDTAVSLQTQVPTMFSGEGDILGNSKLKVPSPDQIYILEGGGKGGGGVRGNSKVKVPSPDQIFISRG